jgi:hypothetical protein
MSAPKVYIAAPWECAPTVRNVHTILRDRGFEPTSSWAELPEADGTVEMLTPHSARKALAINTKAIGDSHAMLFICRKGLGGEAFVEFALARSQAIPVFWVGPRVILSTFSPGVTLCDSLPDAIAALEVMKGSNPWSTETL